jgi:hypothetical protein
MRHLILLLLFIVACQPTSPVIEKEEYRVGSEALVVALLDNNPPSSVYENEEFYIAARLQNQGAEDITDGYLHIRAEQDLIELEDNFQLNSFQLEGKSYTNPYGGEQIIEFKGKAKPITLSSLESTSVALQACYDYKTIVEEEICIQPTLSSVKIAPESCTMTSLSLSPQGAPVAVSVIEPKSTITGTDQKNVQLKITVTHNGDGVVALPVSSQSLCTTSQLDRKIFNRVQVQGNLGGRTLECRRKGIVILEDGGGDITCTVQTPSGSSSFSTSVYLELSYSYVESIARTMEIERLK